MRDAIIGFAAFGLLLAVLVIGLGVVVGWLHARGVIGSGERSSASAVGNALLEVQAIVEPGKRAVVEARRAEGDEQDADGADDPDRDATSRSD